MLGVVKYLAASITHYMKFVVTLGVTYEKNSSSQHRRVRLLASMGSGMTAAVQRVLLSGRGRGWLKREPQCWW